MMITEVTRKTAIRATLLDPESVGRVPSGVTWAPKLMVVFTRAFTGTGPPVIELRLGLKPALAQWLPDMIAARSHWVVPVSVLALGLDGPAGEGDVMVCPSFRRDLIEIVVSDGGASIGLRVRREALLDLVTGGPS